MVVERADRLEDLAAALADHRARGAAIAELALERLDAWLAGWRAEQARALAAESDARRWRRIARRAGSGAGNGYGRRGARGAAASGRGGR